MTKAGWLMVSRVVGFIFIPAALIVAGARGAGLGAPSATTAQALAPPRNVWKGVYTEEQAQRGAQAYQQACSRCHGENLKGKGDAPALIGPAFFDRWAGLSVQDLFFRVQITMSHVPSRLFAPSETVGDIVSFVFRANKIPAGVDQLPLSEEQLRHIFITRDPVGRGPTGDAQSAPAARH